MAIHTVPTLEECEEIVARLQRLSSEQRLIEQACSGYAQWYQVVPEDYPLPQDVQITFRLQTLYFQPGVDGGLPAYISTVVELDLPQEDSGLYLLFTNLDGSYRDDLILLASMTSLYAPLEDYGLSGPIEPVELRNVPLEMQDIFLPLAHLAQHQRLVDRATEQCLHWFNLHPTWYKHYPFSLAEEGIKKDLRWLREYPLWEQYYPKDLLKGPEIRIGLARQVLCFNHARYAYPHIKTYMNIYAGGYDIGTYCLVTKLNGTMDEDLSIVVPYPFHREV